MTAPPPPDFTLNVTATPSTTLINQSVTWNGSLQAINNYNKSVSLSCTAGKPGTCTIQPASLVPTAGGASFTVTVGSASVATYNFSIQGTDNTLTHSQAVSLAVHDFTVPNPADPAAIHPGQKATVTLNISPTGSNTFDNSVNYSCTSMPAGATCAFLPLSPIAAGQPATQVQLTVSTAGPFTGTQRKLYGQTRRPWLPLSLPLAGIVLAGLAGPRIPRRYKIGGLCLTLGLAGLLVGCGGGGGGTTPPPITVTVSPTPVNTLYPNLAGAPTQSVNLTASVSGTSNQAVTWAITVNKTDDSINSTGTNTAAYTAPSAVPAGAIKVTATSQADPTATGNATINLQAPTPSGAVTVSVTEGGLTHTATFNLTVN